VLSADEKTAVTNLITTLVPSMIALFPKIEAGVIAGFTEAEKEATTCWAWCCCRKA
jgi:hypothetical protein